MALGRRPGADRRASRRRTARCRACSPPSRPSGRRLYLVAFDAGRRAPTGSCSTTPARSSSGVTTCARSPRSSRCASSRPSSRAAATSSSSAAQLVQVRMVEQPAGIEEAEAAALALEQAVGSAPRRRLPGLSRRGGGGDAGARAGARRARVAVLRGASRRHGRGRGVRARGRARLPRRPALTWMHGRRLWRLPVRR